MGKGDSQFRYGISAIIDLKNANGNFLECSHSETERSKPRLTNEFARRNSHPGRYAAEIVFRVSPRN